jgi:CHAD domain-containing protein
MVGNCLMQIQENEPGLKEAADPEYVHQMRIGLRRLRSALNMFAPVARCPGMVDQELRWLSGVLGRARDWDVLGGQTLPAIGTAYPNEPGLKKLRLAVLAVAAKKRRLAAAAVGSGRYARLFLMLGKWTQEIGRPGAPDASLTKFAGRLLDLAYRKLQRRGKRLPQNSPRKRHKARIAAKQLRYATEFFQSLYPERAMRRFIDRLAGLQKVLGRLNDAAVAGRLLRQFARDRPASAQSAGFARAYLATDTENRARDLLGRQWERFERRKPGWK